MKNWIYIEDNIPTAYAVVDLLVERKSENVIVSGFRDLKGNWYGYPGVSLLAGKIIGWK